ncbi:carboxylesterase/lipase family protein [Amycolatopsis taiwanensis]|uniref:Carboxylic ester hydrolase n=1 Tax=Amycolatopsis taiwanensis TaxID=342230 RepID=A0A9W6QYC3_9PSEU|nr:carboxylesterase/lipase family protein [Amycolatopsis taiwanensis]GLY64257.1 carboxylic ester hydrolase [Amycolatopsis taiwanensis]
MLESGLNRKKLARGITRLSWVWLLGRAFIRLVRNRKRNRRRVVLSALALVVVPLGASMAMAATDPAIVDTDDGALRGAVASDHRTFSGIPFAAPPVDNLRWQAPQPAVPWSGIRDATRPGSMCAQVGWVDGKAAQIGSEDCLYLNVTTPSRGTGLPVMVWIPGGGFVQGAGDQYDPARLAATGNVVVVTINYRLDALGFLDDPDFGDDPDAGNYGLADQQAALRWVRHNIASFGGDPGNVTVFGQSAGAFSICAHLVAPASRALFDKAIIQSGPCGNSFVTADVARKRGKEVAARLGCATGDVATCLRAKPVNELVGIDGDHVFTSTDRLRDMPWTPVVGTPVLPEQPLQALRDGHAARVPLIQGATRDEMRPFVALDYDVKGTPVTEAEYPNIIRQVFGAKARLVLEKYPPSNYPSPGIALATVLTDAGRKVGACTTLPADTAAAARMPVYAYEFAQDDGLTIGDFPMGAAHSAELPYLFDGSFGSAPLPPTPDRQLLSQRLISYWAQFAKTGDPNNSEAPPWPAYHPGQPLLSIKAGSDGIGLVDLAREHQCPLWS